MRTTAWRLAVLCTALLLGMAFLPPVLDPQARAVVMAGFSALCHQLPERSLHFNSVPLAVCSRCLGIYGGLLVGVLSFPWVVRWGTALQRSAGKVLVAALLVPGADWLAGVLQFWESGHSVRIVTGAAFGVVAGYFLARGAVHLVTRTAGSQETAHGT